MQSKVGGTAPTSGGPDSEHATASPAIGKRTLVEAVTPAEPDHGPPVQRKVGGEPVPDDANPTSIASQGTAGIGGQLPHYDRIQAAFGHHDVSGVKSHEGGAASEASRALGARAYAHGDAIAFASSPDLHTAAHEAAHVVQQRGGVQLSAGIDQPGDSYERNADAVADAVVAGSSAEPLLDQRSQAPRSSEHGAAVQRKPDDQGTGTPATGKAGAVHGVTPVNDDQWLAKQLNAAKAADPNAAPADESRNFVDPDPDPGTATPIQTEVHFIAGRTSRRALVLGGVHGSEPEGEVVVRQLIEALKKATTKPFFTVILVPRLIGKTREDPAPKSHNAPFREVDDKTAKGAAGASSKGTGSEGNIEVEPNRNFPLPGTSYDSYKKAGHLEFWDASAKKVRAPRDVVKIDGKKENRAKAVASEKMLPENRLLVHLIERFQPERLVSVHQHSVPGGRGDGPGVFVDPRRPATKLSADDGFDPTTDQALTPEGQQDDKLGAAMRDAIQTDAEAAGLRKQGLDPLAGNAVPLPGTKSKKPPTVHYKTGAHAEGNSLGDYAPVAVKEGGTGDRPAIGTITIEIPQYDKSKPDQADALSKLEAIDVAALQRIFLGDPSKVTP
jgi:uncharacterized protein DUF4157